MPNTKTKKLACGDVSACDDCTHDDRKDGHDHIATPTHAMNQRGRCDFYDGPDNDVFYVDTTFSR